MVTFWPRGGNAMKREKLIGNHMKSIKVSYKVLIQFSNLFYLKEIKNVVNYKTPFSKKKSQMALQ